jgi:disulfide bond formation protein DsbB
MDAFLALLALASLLGAAAVIAVIVVPSLRGWLPDVGAAAVPLATLVAVAATVGSLYLSEVRDFVPCEFCWYQRIAMYPLGVVLGVAAIRRRHDVIFTALPLAAVGAGLSTYHYQLQLFPEQGSSCSAVTPCTGKWVEEFGFVTIPFMALAGFVFVGALVIADHIHARGAREQT